MDRIPISLPRGHRPDKQLHSLMQDSLLDSEDSYEKIQQLVPHIFLPRKLPGQTSSKLVKHETNLLRLLSEVVVDASTKIENKCLNQVVNLFKTWVNLQEYDELDSQLLSETISALKPGESIALYIRAQNAGFLLTQPDDEVHKKDVAILSTFPAMPKMSDVMSKPGDLTANFPSSSIHIPISDLLNSDSLRYQLSILCSTPCKLAFPEERSSDSTLKDVPDPLMVSRLITGMLTNAESDICCHLRTITKTVRDQVTLDAKHDHPFRRSGLWMVAKVVLQLTLINGKNKTDGIFMYKMIMLKLMSLCCKKLANCVDIDLCMQMLAKLARRVRKLEKYHSDNITGTELGAFYLELQRGVIETMGRIKEIVKHQWTNIINEDTKMSMQLPLPLLDFQCDTKHLLAASKKYFTSLNGKHAVKPDIIPLPKCPPRYQMSTGCVSQFPLSHFETEGEEDLGIVLCEFERYVRRMLEKYVNASNTEFIRKLLEKYVQKAKTYYINDPVGTSRMVLTSLKIVQVLDKIAINQHRLLKEHRSGVDVDFIKDLLLPQLEDMELAQNLEFYFRERNKTRCPSLIEEEQISRSSFSVRFAQANREMGLLREKILADAEADISAKLEEVKRGKDHCHYLRRRAADLTHDSATRTDKWGIKETYHPNNCTKCSINSQADRYKVNLYERPLPSNEREQNAVAFELLIPDEIVSLRDALYFFNTKVCLATMTSNNKVKSLWTDYSEIFCYHKGKQRHIALGTTKNSATSSRSSCSPETCSEDQFIVNNGFNCHFSADSKCLSPQGKANIKNICSFSISTDSLYKDLDNWLKNTSHQQNEVLAKQSECPPNMSLCEFKEFGSLRAGHRLQLRNIYRALQQESLSFHKEPVFSLICQSIWQAGPPSETNVSREAHEDLADPNFAKALLQLLNEILEQQSENWTNYFTMLTIIVLSTRILSLNHDVKEEALDILLKCRKVSESWINKIENVLSETADFPKDKVEKLRLNLTTVNLCTALTFWVDQNYIPRIMNGASHVECWLKAITRIKDNIILSTESVDNLPLTIRSLLRWTRNTGIAMEDHIHNILEQDSKSLDDFISGYWSGSQKGNVKPWRSCGGNDKQLYQAVFENDDSKSMMLNVDIIRGNFLVNGCPVGHLPSAIAHHKDYYRVFSNIIFEVQPDQPDTYVTALKYHGSNYAFSLQQNNLIVKEIQKNGVEYELVPHHIFERDIPFLLINEYSHWWNRVKKTVSFRPMKFTDKEFQTNVKYILELETYTISDLSTKNLLIDINSTSYKELQKTVGRIEHQNYIHMFWRQKAEALVELSRMSLHFELYQESDGQIQLLSVEYPGMKVSKKQKFGTFVGLNQGLLLDSINASIVVNPVFLIPHGVVRISPGAKHQNVKIDLDSQLRDPHYFAFEVDKRLCELRASQSQSAWVYLVLLHAASASPLPDPFNSLTGTEAALHLLQSPRCWSCKPLDKEVQATLKSIAQISPCRQYYPSENPCAEYIKWPIGVGSLAAHDGYEVLVQLLVQQSQRLVFLNQSCTNYESYTSEQSSPTSVDLCNSLVHKSYWRTRHFYTEQAQILCAPELESLNSSPSTMFASTFNRNLDDEYLKNVRMIAHLGHNWICVLPKRRTSSILMKLLIEERGYLTGLTNFAFSPVDVIKVLDLDFRHSWLDLYNFAKKVKIDKKKYEWIVLLSTLAFAGASVEQLKLLHSVAVHPEKFQSQNPPPHTHYVDCEQNEYDSSVILSLIKQSVISFDQYESRTGNERKYREESWDYELRKKTTMSQYNSSISNQIQELAKVVQSQWPTKACNVMNKSRFSEIRLDAALWEVNRMLNKWYSNRELEIFLQKTERVMFEVENSQETVLSHELTQTVNFQVRYTRKRICEVIMAELVCDCHNLALENEIQHIYETGYLAFGIEPSTSNCIPASITFPWKIDDECKIGSTYMTDTKSSWDAYHKNCRKPVINDIDSNTLIEQLERKCSFYSKKGKSMWLQIENMMQHANETFAHKAVIAAGLLPRITPTTMLPLLCEKQLDENLRNLIGATAVLWTLVQRANRCLRYIRAEGGSMVVHLKKELVCRGHENWSPREKPEWLLLELEMDLMIRPIQVEVANAMLNPENNKHAVMQLNMGEGKTTVIIPMVAATLGNGKQLCRVTVLKSLFHMNLNALAFKLGGLLNRRVYTLTCRRDMVIGKAEANNMLQMYKECTLKRGVVMTLPEYRLSFELKGYEKSRNGNFEDATELLEVQEWLKQHARDVLDESDEILHVKYQLVYTVGEQLLVDGGSLRWTVAQRLLKLIPSQLEKIMKHTVNAAECNRNAKHPECFPHCRLLKVNCYKELLEKLVADILEGKLRMEFPCLTTKQNDTVAYFLKNEVISDIRQNEIMQMIEQFSTSFRDILLILRGLLACGVLSLVLNKRWKVNYGININWNRLTAVPFRAKDVAAERTEFGHPDVAILCTTMSYYYSGLSESQLDHCFEILYLQNNCDEEYDHWISNVTSIHPSIKKLRGINLADYKQRTKCVYPALLKNMAVIDFWLDRVVFPKEAKQFGWKMSCSAWDLCSDEAIHPVTGFSGTNDSKLLLPLNISQKDLPELLGTSGEVLHNLLLKENNNYRSLKAGMTNVEILELLVKANINLLLDVGALMIEFDNKTLACKWLDLIPNENPKDSKEAAIYFDIDNQLVVTDRQGRTNLLDLSSFRRRMDKCIIYLDDFHTRGTDLKIPCGTKGCVTLGKGITKDKLVQGCMRMRMLGEGHTVCFWASKEVDDEINSLCGHDENLKKIKTKHVLAWAMENSKLATRDGFLYWTTSGFNFLQKKVAHLLFDQSQKTDNSVVKLGERCTDSEVIELMEMYGTVRKDAVFWETANARLKTLLSRVFKSLMPEEVVISFNVQNEVNIIGNRVITQCKHFVPKYKRVSSLLDEEQERELEHELEEECEIQRPPVAEPASSNLNDGVVKFVKDGVIPTGDANSWCVRLPLALQSTALWPNQVQEGCWGQNIFASNDFVCVVKNSSAYKHYSLFANHSNKTKKQINDEFLRSPTWIAVLMKNNTTTLLLLSPFEVNQLMPVFRSEKAAAVLHMYAARMHLGQDNLLQCPLLTVPPNKALLSNDDYRIFNVNLSLFSGNLYFSDKMEQDDYVTFLGLLPHPRSSEEQKVIDEGGTCNGFIKAEYRERLPHVITLFLSNPVDLLRGIIDRRHEYFPSMSHIASMILESKKPIESEDDCYCNTDNTVDLFDDILDGVLDEAEDEESDELTDENSDKLSDKASDGQSDNSSKSPEANEEDDFYFNTDNTVDLFDDILDGVLDEAEDEESDELTDQNSDKLSDKASDGQSDNSSKSPEANEEDDCYCNTDNTVDLFDNILDGVLDEAEDEESDELTDENSDKFSDEASDGQSDN